MSAKNTLPRRLSLGPLPTEFATYLRSLSANVRLASNNADASATSPERTEIELPFTGKTLGWVETGTADTVELAFRAARRAQRSWSCTPLGERKAIFLRFHDAVLRHRDLLCDMVQLETGKNRASAFDEVMDVANNARFYANNAAKYLKTESRRSSMPLLSKSRQLRHPVGVVGQISPWNYPLALAIGDAIPAILAGNSVVAKPDSSTPFTSLLVFSLLYDAGLPRDVAQIVTGPGGVVGSAIADSCDFLMFTGSTATGKRLGRQVGERLVGFSAELGGKNPMLIASDADLAYTVRGAIDACFSNSGQLCVSIERIYADAAIYDAFVKDFGAAVRGMRLSNSFDWEASMGSLASQAQLDTVTHYVGDALSKGARVIAGGRARPDLGPYFYEPTVLVDVPHDALLRREEVFGPVVYIDRVPNMHRAIELANDTSYGLNASVFAAPDTAWQLAKQIESGSVAINDGYVAAWAAIENPMGGIKESGMSQRHGKEGFVKYTVSQNVTEQRWMAFRGPRQIKRAHFSTAMARGLALGKLLRILP